MFHICYMLWLFLLLMILGSFAFMESKKPKENLRCDYFNYIECEKNSSHCNVREEVCRPDDVTLKGIYCYVAWKNESNGIRLHYKGCWYNDPQCADKFSCTHEPRDANDMPFCCCEGDFCNSNFSALALVSVPTSLDPPLHMEPVGENHRTRSLLFYILFPVFGILVLIAIICIIYRKHKRSYDAVIPDHNSTRLAPSLPQCYNELQNIQLLEMKAKGRFGEVFMAQMGKELVAVKIFPVQDRDSWFREQQIYNLPQMRHQNILQFIGIDQCGKNLEAKLWLVTAYHELGSLSDYLKSNLVTWKELCHIGQTMACGLAHLHEEQPSSVSGTYKPSIAHRDFKSKNVLLKSDMTACIGDFGLAMTFERGKSPGDIHGQVGTRRYMAPEVLEGAICFRHDAFLRIDMYACALVLWELVSRCSVAQDLSSSASEYKLPFEAEVGSHPTLEDMQEIVVHKKQRPNIKQCWLQHHDMESLMNTIEECWDQDAEARLSASCVEERIALLCKDSPNKMDSYTITVPDNYCSVVEPLCPNLST